ncbi:flavodoxin domain-containing protein [Pseudoflavonifractor phocaeensis]|uniref:flavodoxin domain-containing protein n=1 Tax=Pseudoflavonifractor phocaeensis TaxID=1870988 RepID=UPI00313D8034
MNAIVIYRSRTGFTKRYAQWLAEDLGCEAAAYEDRDKVELSGFDTVLYGDFLHAGALKGLDWLKAKLPELEGKRVAVFAVGACPADDPSLGPTLERSLEGVGLPCFYLRGGLDYENMGFLDKMMMKMMCAMVKKKEGPDSETYRGISCSFDATDRASLALLEAWARGK